MDFGFVRSPKLGLCGAHVILAKAILVCRCQNDRWSMDVIKSARRLKIDLAPKHTASYATHRKGVRQCHDDLWATQKAVNAERTIWLEALAQDRAQASGNPDWKAKMKEMIRRVEERTVNHKLLAITKDTHRQLDRIQIPNHNWFHLPKSRELFHYDDGVFEAYPATNTSTFFKHHTIKVLPKDGIKVEVTVGETEIVIQSYLPTNWFHREAASQIYNHVSPGRVNTHSHLEANSYASESTEADLPEGVTPSVRKK